MTYQQAGRIAVLKRILGWVIFIPALISTLISLLKFMNTRQENKEGINAVMLDFTHVMHRYDAGEYAFFESILV